jgi:hypothetical protein
MSKDGMENYSYRLHIGMAKQSRTKATLAPLGIAHGRALFFRHHKGVIDKALAQIEFTPFLEILCKLLQDALQHAPQTHSWKQQWQV